MYTTLIVIFSIIAICIIIAWLPIPEKPKAKSIILDEILEPKTETFKVEPDQPIEVTQPSIQTAIFNLLLTYSKKDTIAIAKRDYSIYDEKFILDQVNSVIKLNGLKWDVRVRHYVKIANPTATTD